MNIIDEIMNKITLYMPFLTMTLGTLGGLCNILTFTSKELRYNSCGFYFLCSTIFDIIYLLLSNIIRFLTDQSFFKIKINRSVLFCKCRTYLLVVIPTLSMYFILVITIDRCLSTSRLKKWRDLSRINVAWCVSIMIIILGLLFHSHIFFFFDLQTNPTNNNVHKCVPYRGLYTIFVYVYLFSLNPFLTYGIMFVCSIITFIRIRKLRCRLGFLHNRTRKHRIIDRHLITIMLVQVGLGMLFTFFRCAFLVYSFSTNNTKKTISKITTELFLDKFSLIIYYMNFAKSFPVNTLTSPLFHRIFQQRIIYLFTKICPCVKEQRSIVNRVTIKRRNFIA